MSSILSWDCCRGADREDLDVLKVGCLAEGHPKVSSLKAALSSSSSPLPPHHSVTSTCFPFLLFLWPPFFFFSVSLLSALFTLAVYWGCHGDCQNISASWSSGPVLVLAMGSGRTSSCPSEGAVTSSKGCPWGHPYDTSRCLRRG